MQFEISKEQLLRPLMNGSGVVEKRQTLPVLSNVLLRLENGCLEIAGTDLEVEVSAICNDVAGTDGSTTVPARKFVDIVRSFPEESMIMCDFVLPNVPIFSSSIPTTILTERSAVIRRLMPSRRHPISTRWQNAECDSNLLILARGVCRLEPPC